MSGVAGLSGRKKKTISRENAHRSIVARLPRAIEVIGETLEGANKDRLRYEAAVEIKDSALGKPKQQTDIDLKGVKAIGMSTLLELYQLIASERKQLSQGVVVEGECKEV